MTRVRIVGAGLLLAGLGGCGTLSERWAARPRLFDRSESRPVEMVPTSSSSALPPGAYIVPGSMRTMPCTNCGGAGGPIVEGPMMPPGSTGEPGRVLPRPRPIDGKVDEGPFAKPKEEGEKMSLVKPIPPNKGN